MDHYVYRAFFAFVFLCASMLAGAQSHWTTRPALTFPLVTDEGVALPYAYDFAFGGGKIALTAITGTGYEPNGLYLHNEERVRTLISPRRINPAIGGRPIRFGIPSISETGGRIAFWAVSNNAYNNGKGGIYLWQNGKIRIIADHRTLVPGSTQHFTFFSQQVTVSEKTLAFIGGNATEYGIYALAPNGRLTTVANRRTLAPQTQETFQSFGQLSSSGINLAFVGHFPSRRSGVFGRINGKLHQIAVQGTPVLGQNRTFRIVTLPVVSGNDVVFSGISAPPQQEAFYGVYRWSANRLTVIADSSQSVPDGSRRFGHVGYPMQRGDTLAFTESPIVPNSFTMPQYLYVQQGEAVTPLVTPETTWQGESMDLVFLVSVDSRRVYYTLVTRSHWQLFVAEPSE